MTEFIPGKRYRWIVEGTANKAGGLVIDDSGVALSNEWFDVGTVELLVDPLPTTPGSVVQFTQTGTVLLLLDKGLWVNKLGFPEYEPAQVAMHQTTVLFDAGVAL